MKRHNRERPDRRAARGPAPQPSRPPGTTMPSPPRRPSAWLVALALALATFALYLPTLANDFVHLDDPEYVLNNPVVQQGITLEGIRWAFTTTRFANWLPITWLSHMLDCELFGLWAGGHHLTSSALHALNAALVFLVLRRMTGSLWRAAAVAAVFAVHPLRVESVAWVAERKDVLCATFGLLTIFVWVGYCRTASAARYVTALVLYALGLMSKTMIVTLPFLLLLLDLWPLRRVGGAGRTLVAPCAGAETPGKGSSGGEASAPVSPARSWPRLIAEKLPLLALAAIASAWTASLQYAGGAMRLGARLSLEQRVANAVVSVPRYLAKTVRPVDLSVFYPHPGNWPVWMVVASAALVLALTVAVLAAFKRRPYLAVGWFWFLGMLVPVSGIVQVGSQSIADRYTYLPGIGLLIAAVWGIADLARGSPRVRAALRPAAAAVLLVLAVGTLLQQRYWAGTVELFEHAVAIDEDNWLAHGMLGIAAHEAGLAAHSVGDEAQAIEHFRRAIAANPDHPDARHNLGVALKRLGRGEEALAAFLEAARHPPPRSVTYGEIGELLAERGDWPAADAAFAEAERLDPAAPAYPMARGDLALEMGRRDVAAQHFRRALQLDPNNADAHRGLAKAIVAPSQ